jgi:signal transduction histidine kinase
VEKVETQFFNRRGEKIPVQIYAYPVKEKDLIIGLVLYLADAREIRRYEDQKRRFMSMVAHDFKAPLVISLGFVQRLLQEKAGPLTAKQQTYLETVSQELQKLEGLILSFLEMLRFETGRLKLELAPCEAGSLVREVCERFRLNAEKKEILLKPCLPEEELWLVADRLQLERALANLLDNAIKYSPSGTRVEIRLFQEEETVVFEVEDQGPGIPAEEIPHIFEPFYRVSREAKISPGTGLGLAIVKNVVEAHGGSINVESIIEQGTKFYLRFPKKCPLNTIAK